MKIYITKLTSQSRPEYPITKVGHGAWPQARGAPKYEITKSLVHHH